MEEEKKEFVVKDRRVFSEEAADEVSEQETEPVAPDRSEETEPSAAGPKETAAGLPQINFQTFVFSLNASALVQLGLMEDPASGKKEKNLPLVKQTIDLLSMLEEKTKGNLSKDEDEMLKHILYDLRIRYVKEKG
jgi:uncharacterized protein DUF1844